MYNSLKADIDKKKLVIATKRMDRKAIDVLQSILILDEPLTSKPVQDYISSKGNLATIRAFQHAVKECKLEQYVLEDMYVIATILQVNTINEYNIFLIELLDFYNLNDRPAYPMDVMSSIYPDGFYNEATIEKLLKHLNLPQLVKSLKG